MAKANAQLATALKQAKTPMYFAFVAKTPSLGTLLVDKKRIPPKDIGQAKTDLGGGTIFQGRCFHQEGTMIFEVAKEPPGTLAAQLKKVMHEEAGVTFSTVEVRVNKVVEEGGEGDVPTPPPPPPAPPPTAKAAPAGAPGKPAATGDLVSLQQARLVWSKARQTVRAELEKLEKSILAICKEKEEPDYPGIVAGTKDLYEILEVLDESLIDKLDEALNAPTPEQRTARHDEARDIIADYLEFVKNDALIGDIDDNGFTPVHVRSTLTTTLNALAGKLG
jgi:hypothetical protein